MEANSRANDSPSRPSLGHLIIVFIHRRDPRDLLRWRHRGGTLQTRGVPVHLISVLGSPGVLIVSPLVVGLMWLVVVVAGVWIVWPVIVRIVVLSVVVPAIALVEFAAVLLLFLRGAPVVVSCVHVVVLRVLPVRHRSQELGRVGSKEGDAEGRRGGGVKRRKRTRGGGIVAPGNCGLPHDRFWDPESKYSGRRPIGPTHGSKIQLLLAGASRVARVMAFVVYDFGTRLYTAEKHKNCRQTQPAGEKGHSIRKSH